MGHHESSGCNRKFQRIKSYDYVNYATKAVITQVCYGNDLSLCQFKMQKILKMGKATFRPMTSDPFCLKCSIYAKKSKFATICLLNSAHAQYLKNILFEMAKCNHQNLRNLNLAMHYELDKLS